MRHRRLKKKEYVNEKEILNEIVEHDKNKKEEINLIMKQKWTSEAIF